MFKTMGSYWHFYFCVLVQILTLLCFWPYHPACGLLITPPGIESVLPAVEVQSLNDWTAREVLVPRLLITTCYIFLDSKITADGDWSHEIKRLLLLGRKAMTNLDSVLKSRHHFADKGLYSQSYGFSSSHIWIWELDHKEGWAPKNGCFRIVVVEKTLESPLDSKEIKPVNPKGNKSWILIGRTDAEAPILWPSDVKSWLIRKDPDAGKDWRQEEKGMTEEEMVGWHHQFNGHDFEQAPGGGEGQGGLAYCLHEVTKSQTRLSDWQQQQQLQTCTRGFIPQVFLYL